MTIPCLYLVNAEFRSQMLDPQNKNRGLILLGVWAGALPLIHTHSFLALGLASAGSLEAYLAPGKNTPYHCILHSLEPGGLAIYNPVYSQPDHREIDEKDPAALPGLRRNRRGICRAADDRIYLRTGLQRRNPVFCHIPVQLGQQSLRDRHA